MRKITRRHLQKTRLHTYYRNMDPNLPAPQTPLPDTRRLYLPLIFIVLLILGLVGAYYYLNYYRPKDRSQGTPKKIEKELVFAQRLLQPSSIEASEKSSYTCPTTPTFCQRAESYQGSSFSATLRSGASLFAAFDGILTNLPSSHPTPDNKEEEFTLLILTAPQQNLQAMYYLKGVGTTKTEVKAGEVIATASGQPITFMDNKSFIFTLIEATKEGGQTRALKASDFK